LSIAQVALRGPQEIKKAERALWAWWGGLGRELRQLRVPIRLDGSIPTV